MSKQRLIDANALINRIVFHTDWTTDEKEAFEDEINAEPTIEERKTGKWIIEPYDVENDIWVHRCGECMKVAMLGIKKSRFNYCPNCGTRMLQEGEDNERA